MPLSRKNSVFFAFDNKFSYTQLAFVINLLRDFFITCDILLFSILTLIFCFILRKVIVPFTRPFFEAFLCFCIIYSQHFYILGKNYISSNSEKYLGSFVADKTNL